MAYKAKKKNGWRPLLHTIDGECHRVIRRRSFLTGNQESQRQAKDPCNFLSTNITQYLAGIYFVIIIIIIRSIVIDPDGVHSVEPPVNGCIQRLVRAKEQPVF